MEKNAGSYGVTYEEFWFKEMGIVSYKLAAFKAQQELEMAKIDVLAWYTGAYVMDSIGATFSKQHHYPQSPKSRERAKTTEQKAVEQFNRLEQWRKKATKKKVSR